MIDIDTIDGLLSLARARNDADDEARMILAKGYVKRKTGVRQASTELQEERNAFQHLRQAGVESDPEVAYYNAVWDSENA